MALKGSGIRDNFIEIKADAQIHDEATFKACQDAIVAVTPGKVAVLCDKHVERIGSVLVAYGVFEGSMDSDTGTVLHSGYKWLQAGDRVGFLPLHGLRCHQPEMSWVPEGCEIRFFGFACPVNESLVKISD